MNMYLVCSACEWSPDLLVDGVQLLLQHEREGLCVGLAARGEEGGANVVVQIWFGLHVAAQEVSDAPAQRGEVLLKEGQHREGGGGGVTHNQPHEPPSNSSHGDHTPLDFFFKPFCITAHF